MTRNPWTLAALAILLCGLTCRLDYASAADGASPHRFFVGANGNAYLKYFFNQQDDLQEERYVTEAQMKLEYFFYSRNDSFFYLWDVRWTAGMGSTVTENLPFSPKEMSYEWCPVLFENREDGRLYRLGWLHACHHLILKSHANPWYTEAGADVEPVVYYNRIFVGVGNLESRREIQHDTFFPKEGHQRPAPSWIWYMEAAHYLRDLGGLIEEKSLYGHNDWTWEAKLDVRRPLWRKPSWALFANSRTHVLGDTDRDLTWRETLELEVLFDGEQFGTSLFLGAHILDDHPQNNQEELLDFGFHLFF